MIARQFIAWNRPQGARPGEGYGMIVALVCWLFAFCATAFLGFFKTSSHHGTSGVTISQTVPTGRILSCAQSRQ
jgi:hypothetical protein